MIRRATDIRAVERDGVTYHVVKGPSSDAVGENAWAHKILAVEPAPRSIEHAIMQRFEQLPEASYGYVWTRYAPLGSTDDEDRAYRIAARAFSLDLIREAFPVEFETWEKPIGDGAPAGFLTGVEMPSLVAAMLFGHNIPTDGDAGDAIDRLDAHIPTCACAAHTKALLALLLDALRDGNVAAQVRIATLYAGGR